MRESVDKVRISIKCPQDISNRPKYTSTADSSPSGVDQHHNDVSATHPTSFQCDARTN